MNNTIFRPLTRFLSNPSLVALVLFSVFLGAVFYFMGGWLLPLIISIAVAYLLEGVIQKLEYLGIGRIFAVNIIFFLFFASIFYGIFAVVPIIIEQARNFITSLPQFFEIIQTELTKLTQKYPNYFSAADLDFFFISLTANITEFSKSLFSNKLLSSVIFVFTILVYFILVPLLVFFLLKDKKIVLNWLGQFLPENSQIIHDIWSQVDMQIGNYIRGKFIEIVIVWVACLVPFYYFKLNYWLLLSFMVGLSVLIPYIGATLVTFPVLIVAYMQFGDSSTFYWITCAYFVVQILDGNVFVPLIFSEAVNIHPVGIISAVLIFGGLWGFWGLFFAIPLATLVTAIMAAWRKYELKQDNLLD